MLSGIIVDQNYKIPKLGVFQKKDCEECKDRKDDENKPQKTWSEVKAGPD